MIEVIIGMLQYEQLKQALAPIKKPCAFLHMEALEKNIKNIATRAGNKKIRVASKSIRSVAVLEKIFEASEQFQGIMCFTAEESLFLSEQGFDDLLIAYPIWDEDPLRKICQKLKNDAIIILMIDSMEHIERLETIAREEKGKFLVAIDIDLSTPIAGIYFGVYRSPLKTVDQVMNLVQRINSSPYLILDGLMGYEAQIAGVVDAAPRKIVKNMIVRLLKTISMKQISRKRQQIMKALNDEGVSVRFINGGGTGSLAETSNEENITEVTVGSGFYHSHLFDKYMGLNYEAAAGFALEITRLPERNIYTCFGGGYVASGAVGKDKLPEIMYPQGAKLTVNEGVGEVQTPVVYKGSIPLQHGDPIIFRHSKAGELCERFQCLYVIENGRVVDKYTTYRGNGQCFL